MPETKILTLNGGILTNNSNIITYNESGGGGGGGANIQSSKSYTVSASGNATISPDSGYDAMEAVALSVPAGTATAPTSISATGATATSSSTTITLTKSSVSNTPRITTAGYISSGTAGNSSVSLSATDANFTAENIKKNVSLFGKTGSFLGTLTPYTIRPDAELVKTWSYDAYAVEDWELTIPAYSTTAQTVKASEAATGTYTMDYNNYNYYIVQRMLSIPTYSITTKAKGRVEYWIGEYFYEIVSVPADTFHALITPTTYYTSRNTTVTTAGYTYRSMYWSSGSAIAPYTNAVYSVVQTAVAPTNSSGVLTINTPNCTMRGSTTYFVNTFFNAITDIRYQWIAEMYRAPKSNMNINGWGFEQGLNDLIDCAQSSTGKLT